MIEIDGSEGEGGGQIVRTSLALSLITGKAVRVRNIRARREKPGLRPQHLTAVAAAQEIGAAQVEGAEPAGQEITFRPRGVRPGSYAFDVGTAGSTTLVAQTLLPALLQAGAPSQLTLRGGTHNPLAPPFEFLARSFLPLVERMGPRVEAKLDRAGYFPAGGGKIRLVVDPRGGLREPLELLERGPVRRRRACGVVAGLPEHIAEREVRTASRMLGWHRRDQEVRVDAEAAGPGNVLLLEVESEHVTEVFIGHGRKGVRAERVATAAARAVQTYLEAEVPVGVHLADQLLLPLALAGGGRFVTVPPSGHTRTQARILPAFLPVSIQLQEVRERTWEVRVSRVDGR